MTLKDDSGVREGVLVANTNMLNRLRLRERSSAVAQKVQLRLTQPSSWRLPKQPSSIAPPDVWTNTDMDPVPLERRTWGRGAFVTYWVSDLITISTWSSGSAVVTLGEIFMRRC
jgi:NCS1 family nucleobase:cation symporter-1